MQPWGGEMMLAPGAGLPYAAPASVGSPMEAHLLMGGGGSAQEASMLAAAAAARSAPFGSGAPHGPGGTRPLGALGAGGIAARGSGLDLASLGGGSYHGAASPYSSSLAAAGGGLGGSGPYTLPISSGVGSSSAHGGSSFYAGASGSAHGGSFHTGSFPHLGLAPPQLLPLSGGVGVHTLGAFGGGGGGPPGLNGLAAGPPGMGPDPLRPVTSVEDLLRCGRPAACGDGEPLGCRQRRRRLYTRGGGASRVLSLHTDACVTTDCQPLLNLNRPPPTCHPACALHPPASSQPRRRGSQWRMQSRPR